MQRIKAAPAMNPVYFIYFLSIPRSILQSILTDSGKGEQNSAPTQGRMQELSMREGRHFSKFSWIVIEILFSCCNNMKGYDDLSK